MSAIHHLPEYAAVIGSASGHTEKCGWVDGQWLCDGCRFSECGGCGKQCGPCIPFFARALHPILRVSRCAECVEYGVRTTGDWVRQRLGQGVDSKHPSVAHLVGLVGDPNKLRAAYRFEVINGVRYQV